jgi:hypothetical protein
MNPEDVQALDSEIGAVCEGLSGDKLVEAATKYCVDRMIKFTEEYEERMKVNDARSTQ